MTRPKPHHLLMTTPLSDNSPDYSLWGTDKLGNDLTSCLRTLVNHVYGMFSGSSLYAASQKLCWQFYCFMVWEEHHPALTPMPNIPHAKRKKVLLILRNNQTSNWNHSMKISTLIKRMTVEAWQLKSAFLKAFPASNENQAGAFFFTWNIYFLEGADCNWLFNYLITYISPLCLVQAHKCRSSFH